MLVQSLATQFATRTSYPLLERLTRYSNEMAWNSNEFQLVERDDLARASLAKICCEFLTRFSSFGT